MSGRPLTYTVARFREGLRILPVKRAGYPHAPAHVIDGRVMNFRAATRRWPASYRELCEHELSRLGRP